MIFSSSRNLVNRVVVLALFLTGCTLLSGCSQPGEKVVDYNLSTHHVPPTLLVPAAGHYSLYASDAPAAIYTVDLQKDDEVGFVQRGDGSVVAVALGNDIALTNAAAKTYYWKAEPPKKR